MVYLTRMIRPLTCIIILFAALIFIASAANATTSGPYAYIVNAGDNTVSVIDTQTNTVITNITVGNDPDGVAVSPDGTRVYVTNANSYLASAGTEGLNEEEGNGTVSVIDTATNTVTATIPLGYMPGGVAVSPDGTRIYVVNSDNNTVSVIDTTTNNVVASIPVGLMPDGIAVSPDGTKVYVTNWNSSYDPMTMSPGPYINGTVSVIDVATNTVTATVPVGNWPWGIGVSPDGTRIYVTNFYAETISAIDTATNTVTTTIPLGDSPKEVAVSPAGNRLYVTSGNNVSVINAQTNAVIANVKVGTYPSDVALTPDGARIYVANANSNDVSVIDAATNTVIATIPVGNEPSFYGQFMVPAAPMSNPTSMPATSISPVSATPKPSPFVGAGCTGTIVLGAGLYMMARKRN